MNWFVLYAGYLCNVLRHANLVVKAKVDGTPNTYLDWYRTRFWAIFARAIGTGIFHVIVTHAPEALMAVFGLSGNTAILSHPLVIFGQGWIGDSVSDFLIEKFLPFLRKDLPSLDGNGGKKDATPRAADPRSGSVN